MQIDRRSVLLQRVVETALLWPRITIAAWLGAALAVAPVVADLRVETSTESVLQREGKEWAFYQDSQDMFGGDEVLVAMLEAPRPFDPPTLQKVIDLTNALDGVQGVRRIDSLATVPLVTASTDGSVSLAAALADGVPSTEGERSALATRVLNDRIAPHTLVSADGTAFAVNLILTKDASNRYGEILRRLRDALDGGEASLSGVPIFRVRAAAKTRSDLIRFVPLTLIAVAVLLFIVFRRAVAVVVPLVCSSIASWVMVAGMVIGGRPLTITTVILPSLLLAVGCAYGIHLLVAAIGNREDLHRRLVDVSAPIALSGVTTAIGFIAVSFIDIDAITDVGRFGAFGVFVLVLTTLTMGPALLSLRPLGERDIAGRKIIETYLTPYLFSLVYWRRTAVGLACVVLTGVVIVGMTRLQVETDVVRWFPRDSGVRKDYNAIRAELSGISPINVVLRGDGDAVVTEPRVMDAIAGLSQFLEDLPEVGKTVAISDLVIQLHEGFLGSEDVGLPDNRALNEQYLLLLESKEQVHDLVTPDRRNANVLVRVDNNGSSALLRVARMAEEWWHTQGSSGFSATTTGVMYEFARAEEEMSYGQLSGLSFAFGVTATVLLLVFRSPVIALVGLIPNVAPVAIAFGGMGLFGIPLDAGTVLVGNLAFGIAVDDTMHTLLRFRDFRRLGVPVAAAVAKSVRVVLPALLYSTVAVSLGFAVLGISDFLLTRRLGFLTGGVMTVCLVADVLLLPALLLAARHSLVDTVGSMPRTNAMEGAEG